MNNIVQFRGHYEKHATSLQLFDRTFFIGVASTFVLPPIIFCSYFGIIAVVALAASTLIGIGIGVISYRNDPPQMPSCFPAAGSTSLTSSEAEFRLAA
jgi:hypothetical protein